MCDPVTLSLAVGTVTGGLGAFGKADAAKNNREAIESQRLLEVGHAERERIIEKNAANKEAYKASQLTERNKAFLTAKGNIRGASAGERSAEQSRQGALSIANARDRSNAADANFAASNAQSDLKAANRVRTEATYTPLNAFTDIASSAVKSYGMFE